MDDTAPGVLVVEDDDSVRTLAGAMLERMGCPHHLSSDCEDAVAHLRDPAARIGVVLLDVHLEGATNVSGRGAYDVLMAERSVPVILMSGLQRSQVSGFEEVDLVGYLHKPFRFADFRGMIEGVLGGDRQGSGNAAVPEPSRTTDAGMA